MRFGTINYAIIAHFEEADPSIPRTAWFGDALELRNSGSFISFLVQERDKRLTVSNKINNCCVASYIAISW